MALHAGCYTMILLMNVLSILHSFVLNVYKNNASIKGLLPVVRRYNAFKLWAVHIYNVCWVQKRGAEKIKITRR